jgi:hypothetical protein
MTTAKLKFNREWNEWVVKFYINGIYQKKADYHTSDKQDAYDTARVECDRQNYAFPDNPQ